MTLTGLTKNFSTILFKLHAILALFKAGWHKLLKGALNTTVQNKTVVNAPDSTFKMGVLSNNE